MNDFLDNFLFIIPARGGSKGIPNKNISLLAQIPLLEYTIEAALRSKGKKTRVVLSTDSDVIANNCKKFHGLEIPFIRPSSLATDASDCASVVEHALNWYRDNESFFPDYFLLLQPTGPFRNEKHIIDACSMIKKTKADSLISVNSVGRHPCEYIVPNDNDNNTFSYVMEPPSKAGRQNFPKVYFINGAIYISKIDFFKRTGLIFDNRATLFNMEPKYSLDVDEPIDLVIAESYANTDQDLKNRVQQVLKWKNEYIEHIERGK